MVRCYRGIRLLPPQNRLQTYPQRTPHNRRIRSTQGHRKGLVWQSYASPEEGYTACVCPQDNPESTHSAAARRDHTYFGGTDGLGSGEQPLHCPAQILVPKSRQTVLGNVIWYELFLAEYSFLMVFYHSQWWRTVLSSAAGRKIRPGQKPLLRRRAFVCARTLARVQRRLPVFTFLPGAAGSDLEHKQRP